MTSASPAEPAATPPSVLVEGRGPLLVGLRAVVAMGQTVSFGRSRSCPLSLRRSPAFQAARNPEELLRSAEFNRISRVHCEITFRADGRVEVRDRSNNGTWIRGRRIDGAATLEFDARPIEIAPVEGDLGTLLLTRV